MKTQTTRRSFLKDSATLAATVGLSNLATYSFGNPTKIRMGFIGVGNRGTQLLSAFMKQATCEVVALCDIYEPYLSRDDHQVNSRFREENGARIPKMGEQFTNTVKRYKDYKELLADKNIDAVCIATPDHWHALQTIDAIKAGKDVYIEKPLGMTVYEGQKMLEAQKQSNRLVTVGLHRRASIVHQKAAEVIRSGRLGKITVTRAYTFNNLYPNGIGKRTQEAPPADFDWNLWLGPRAFRPYQYNIAPYKFRWWKEYSSQMANWGVHYTDLMRWMLGETTPVSVSAMGGNYVIDDDRTIPDTMQICFEFSKGTLATLGIYEGSSGRPFPFGELEFRGTKGTMYVSDRGYRIYHTTEGQFQKWEEHMEDEAYDLTKDNLPEGYSLDITENMVRDFLNCVQTRKQPCCPLQEGHYSTVFAHLANIAMELKQQLYWNPQQEIFTNSEEANKRLHYAYRKPYHL
ncbi:Gfo/Idh/MocA family protein [Olivibacter domesticus]|uniref:Tat (Twin-arginine translocation) pathway signal sequence n=1 Tax=Olivibacter domesticus TaxID=407022 RepID=A0A1H7QIG4_OLID1|nr:Gfo/Idh/MocA family oxidoreductase [Olivibacter domesticus]SEL47375.1 Tat (twin-arginine translocation) pathway signal sequence [Olivibacter domesticus]